MCRRTWQKLPRVCFQVKHKSGGEIERLKVKEGEWSYSRRLHEDLVAKSWGIDLERWGALEDDTKAEMLAVYEVENKMRAYDQLLEERKRK